MADSKIIGLTVGLFFLGTSFLVFGEVIFPTDLQEISTFQEFAPIFYPFGMFSIGLVAGVSMSQKGDIFAPMIAVSFLMLPIYSEIILSYDYSMIYFYATSPTLSLTIIAYQLIPLETRIVPSFLRDYTAASGSRV